MDGSALRVVTRRRFLGGGVAVAAAALGRPPAAFGQSNEFKGVTLNVACFQHAFTNVLKDLLPDFESRSGMKVNFQTPAFPVYNQRTDLELSTGGGAWDVVNITFIYSGKWIGSGWMTPLEEFIRDRNATPPDWHPEDFVPGAQASVVDAKGVRYGFSWEAGAMILAASRGDLLAKANVKLPETLDDLMRVAAAVDGKDGVKAFGNDNLHHWHWPLYLMAFGGKVFADAPSNLTPTLDSREAVESADYYAKLLRDYSPAGALSFLAYRHLGLLDTRTGLVVVYLTFNLSLVIWMMRGFFDATPRALDEAARIDGASTWQAFLRINLPLAAPGLAATAIFCFLFSWNDFFFALILTRQQATTAPVAVVNFLQYEGWEWGKIAAGGTLVMLPVLVFSVLVRRFLVRGVTAGAVRG